MTKDPSALVRLEARKEKTSSPSSECRREKKRPPRPRASAGEKRKNLLALERVRARKRKSPQCIQGGGDVHPGQVEAPDKVLLAVERVQAR